VLLLNHSDISPRDRVAEPCLPCLASVADSGSRHRCLLCLNGRSCSFANSALKAPRAGGLQAHNEICSDHLRSESSGQTTIVLTLLNAGEHREALNGRPDALPCRRVRYPTVTVEYSACIRYQHSAFEVLSLFLPVPSPRVRDRQMLIRCIDDDHGEQPRRRGVTGVGAHRMMGTGALEPRLTGPVDAGRLVIDLAPDLAREDVGVDESRGGVTVRRRGPRRGVVDDTADQSLPRQVRDRHVRDDGDGFAERRAPAPTYSTSPATSDPSVKGSG
jgi:hypothetical protein